MVACVWLQRKGDCGLSTYMQPLVYSLWKNSTILQPDNQILCTSLMEIYQKAEFVRKQNNSGVCIKKSIHEKYRERLQWTNSFTSSTRNFLYKYNSSSSEAELKDPQHKHCPQVFVTAPWCHIHMALQSTVMPLQATNKRPEQAFCAEENLVLDSSNFRGQCLLCRY